METLEHPLTGIHHLTAVTADVRTNHRFYTKTLGMRLVKRSVNQDDVSAYHLFYADGGGSAGTDLTFFDWAMPRERRGNHSLSRTGLRVPGASLPWWLERLRGEGVQADDIVERDARATLDFEDPEGQRLSLVDDGGRGDDPIVWHDSPVPEEHQIRGLGPITMTVPSMKASALVLERAMGMRLVRDYPNPQDAAQRVFVFEMGVPGTHGPHAELHVAERPDLGPAQLGAGGVHHVAFRVTNDEGYDFWRDRLDRLDIRNSGPVDRYYFRSLYFREPNGILYEIATDGPGFAVDEDERTLGESVVLPPRFEPYREQILANLKPIE